MYRFTSRLTRLEGFSRRWYDWTWVIIPPIHIENVYVENMMGPRLNYKIVKHIYKQNNKVTTLVSQKKNLIDKKKNLIKYIISL